MNTDSSDSLKRPGLLVLASELLFNILYFLDVKDLLSLRKSCRALYELSRQRIVWINAVRGLCEDYGAYSYTFPVDEMDLTELEHTATVHYRFTRRLWNELRDDDEILESEATRILSLSSRINDGQVGDLNGLILLSGGRYLLSSTDIGLIQLWDLGHGPNTIIQRKPLASITPLQRRRMLRSQNTLDGRGIFVLTLSQSTDNHILELHHLSLSSNPPSFSLTATLEFKPFTEDDSIDSVSHTQFNLLSDHVLFWWRDVVLVWNFADGRVAQWRNAEDFASPLDLVLLDENVIVFQAPDALIFDLPAFQPYIPGDVITMTLPNSPVRVPLVRLSFPGTVDYGFSMEPIWGRPSRYFDAIADNAPVHPGISISRYFLRSIPQSSNTEQLPPLPRLLPVLMNSMVADPGMPEAASYRSYRLSDGSRLLFSSTHHQIRVNLSRQVPKDENSQEVTQLSGLLHDWFDIDQESCYGFCPMSGRVCVVSAEREIRVMDYVPLPPNV